MAQKKAPSFLFVVQAKKGEIKKNKAGHYELVLNKADVNHVIMFSDRPYRIVKYITGKNLAADWTKGKNSFKADPPNAILSGGGMKAEIVILSSIHIKDQHIIFGLQGYTAGPIHSKELTITIDLSMITEIGEPIITNFERKGARRTHGGLPTPGKGVIIDAVK